MIFAKAVWWLRKRLDGNERPTDSQAATLAGYYTKAMNLFRALEIDVAAKPVETGRLYHMMLLYLDHDEAICPVALRTASLIRFLSNLGTSSPMPPPPAELPKHLSS